MNDLIINGGVSDYVQRFDMDGRIINASDGGILLVDGTYHWYGMALRPLPFDGGGRGGQVTTVGVVMYASTDLLRWRYEGVILPVSDDPDSELRAPLRFERPKIVYNQRTGQYVLWCHFVGYPGDHGFMKGTAEAGCAVCDRVNGRYRWLGCSRPIDERGLVRDCTVYQDEDGEAYFIYDRHVGTEFKPITDPCERCLHIVRLSGDYTAFTGDYRRIDCAFGREAACLVKHDGWYFMITSGLTGWETNPAKYFRSRALFGPWEDMGNPCVDDAGRNTFNTQGSFIFKNRLTGEDVWMCERHNTADFERCSYVWLPIEYHDDHTLSIRYSEEYAPAGERQAPARQTH